jgi:hypothetical protein
VVEQAKTLDKNDNLYSDYPVRVSSFIAFWQDSLSRMIWMARMRRMKKRSRTAPKTNA